MITFHLMHYLDLITTVKRMRTMTLKKIWFRTPKLTSMIGNHSFSTLAKLKSITCCMSKRLTPFYSVTSKKKMIKWIQSWFQTGDHALKKIWNSNSITKINESTSITTKTKQSQKIWAVHWVRWITCKQWQTDATVKYPLIEIIERIEECPPSSLS